MSFLANLPAELKLCVSESLDPFACFNLGVTCKDNYAVLKPIIDKQRRLAEKYGRLRSQDDSLISWHMLDVVLDNPDVAYHVQEFELDADRNDTYITQEWLNYQQVRPMGGPPAEDALRYVKAAEDNRFLSEPADPDVCQRYQYSPNINEVIEKGYESPVLVTLLCLLPRLRVLRIQDEVDVFWILHALKVLASAYKTPAPNLPFQNLTKVYVAHWDTESCARWAWIHCLIRIPSLRIFKGHMMGGELEDYSDEDHELRHADTPTSNVTELTLTWSCIAVDVLDVLLSHFKDLKIFQYANGGSSVAYVDYDSRGIISALKRHCSHSLEHLSLEDMDTVNRIEDVGEGYTYIHSLKDFKNLKTLQCGFRDIIPGDDEEWEEEKLGEMIGDDFPLVEDESHPDWSHLLPESLECLHLQAEYDTLSGERKQELLETILKSKDSHLSKLRQLYTPNEIEDNYVGKMRKVMVRKDITYEALPWPSNSDDIYTAN